MTTAQVIAKSLSDRLNEYITQVEALCTEAIYPDVTVNGCHGYTVDSHKAQDIAESITGDMRQLIAELEAV